MLYNIKIEYFSCLETKIVLPLHHLKKDNYIINPSIGKSND